MQIFLRYFVMISLSKAKRPSLKLKVEYPSRSR